MTHTPPAFAGLRWYRKGDQWRATFTRLYSAIWGVEWHALKRIGFDTLKDYTVNYSTVTFDETLAEPDEVQTVLKEILSRCASTVERIEGPARRRAEKEQRLRDAAARAPNIFRLYGPACVKRQDWALFSMRQGAGDDLALGKLVIATETKVAVFAAEARARMQQPTPAATADLPDDVVELAIRALTALDSDHAEKANDAGWSRSTTLGGHWCCQMLGTDRTLAIAEGRRLISGHLVQLAKLGVVPFSAVQKTWKAA